MVVLARACGPSMVALLAAPSILPTASSTPAATSSLFPGASTLYSRSFRIRPVSPPTPRPASLLVRAARMESTRVSLGFRAPYFEVLFPNESSGYKLLLL
jgi:hypothetical protein